MILWKLIGKSHERLFKKKMEIALRKLKRKKNPDNYRCCRDWILKILWMTLYQSCLKLIGKPSVPREIKFTKNDYSNNWILLKQLPKMNSMVIVSQHSECG